jgi:hypothetical protein
MDQKIKIQNFDELVKKNYLYLEALQRSYSKNKNLDDVEITKEFNSLLDKFSKKLETANNSKISY